MVDASNGFLKDGNKNRLRDMDIHKMVDVFNKRLEIAGYSRMIGVEEIEKNDFNLNIPRYIDNQQVEDTQDIAAHLQGGIPSADVDALQPYWKVCPQLKAHLFKDNRPNYLDLAVTKQDIKTSIYQHPEFTGFIDSMNTLFSDWQQRSATTLKNLQTGCHPKTIIFELAENLLNHYTDKPLIDKYDVYQHLMDYWAATMQDDCYLIAADGWVANTYRVIEIKKNKQGKTIKEVDKGWACDLVPKGLIVQRYFSEQQTEIDEHYTELETKAAQMAELEEEHGGDEGLYSELIKVNKANVITHAKEIKDDEQALDELNALKEWLIVYAQEAELKKTIKRLESELDALCLAKYPTLSEAEIKTLVVDDKWLATLSEAIHGEMDRISQALTQRVKQLAERYEAPLPQLTAEVDVLAAKVETHLSKMGFAL